MNLNQGALLLAAMLSGCTVFPDKPFVPGERITNNTVVTWQLVDDVAAKCKEIGVKTPPGTEAGACVGFNRFVCNIVTSKTPTMFVLGHELRHCFEGAWHD